MNALKKNVSGQEEEVRGEVGARSISQRLDMEGLSEEVVFDYPEVFFHCVTSQHVE